MSEIRIVTDSTADLPRDLAEKYGITVVPLKVIIGERVYRDGFEMTAGEFYKLLRDEKASATTSQPSPGEFVAVYQALTEGGRQVISIHLSQTLSGTFQSASLARNMLEEPDLVEVVDSRSASMGLGLIVLTAAQAAREGKTKAEILALVHDLINRMNIIFAVETLAYLEKGGRIGKAQALLGSFLNIKPVCSFDEGIVTPRAKARGMGKALDAIVDLVREKVPPGGQIKGCLLHGDNLAGVMKLHEKLVGICSSPELLISEAGPVIGAHTGPGVVGLAFYVV